MSKETKSTSLRIWIAGIASVAVLAIAVSMFLPSAMSSEEIVSEDSESPIASEVTTETPSATSEPTDSVEDSDSLIIEWKEGMTWLDLLTEEERSYLLGLGTPSDSPDADNTSKQSSGKSTPKKPSNKNAYTEEAPQEGDSGQQRDPDTRDCYGQYESACKVGFVAPTVEYAGYLSCQKLEDGTVRLKGLVKLVGGNYRDFSWGSETHNGMGVVSSRVEGFPYAILWDAEATFWSMDDRYEGIIGTSARSDAEIIDESQIDPSCRF